MMKFTLAVLLFAIVGCSTFNQNLLDVDEDYELEQDQPDYEDQPEEDEADDNHNYNQDDVQYEDDDEGEIAAIQGHVRYQDAARDALLQLAAEIRKDQNLTNAFLKVIDGFEKGIAEYQSSVGRRRVNPAQITRTEEFIREAAKNRKTNTNILRALSAQGIYLSSRVEDEGTRGRPAKRSAEDILIGARAFLDHIRREIGEVAFDEYLSVSGLVTLMFAIDTTGSMGAELRAAVAISTQIVEEPRQYDVDYILSPFNDPGTGPITIKYEKEGPEFITALEGLRASGGGDCPELAFKGMLDALDSGPQPGSQMYVFTDASAKDNTDENKEAILDLAFALDVKLNFFVRGITGCGSAGGFEPYKDLASETGGRVYPLKSSLELEQLGQLVSHSLRGSVGIASGGSGSAVSGRRRRATQQEYPISVDDSIESISITVTTQNSGSSISLIDPAGNTVTIGRVLLLKGVIYNIERAISGVYKLIVPADVGGHRYRVEGVSGINIDFGHYYVKIANRGGRVPVPLDQPLQGLPVKAFITIAGGENVRPSSLRIKAVDESGAIQADQPLTAVGTSGVRYFVRFNPPTGPFKLQLHGETVKGNPFVRVSSRVDEATPVLLKLAFREDPNVLRTGQKTSISIIILRGEVGAASQGYTLSLKDASGYGKVSRQPRSVRRGRQGFARIEFDVPEHATTGGLENVVLTLKKAGETSVVAAQLRFSLLIVPRIAPVGPVPA